MVRYIVFTDLDGTLLDHETYRFDAATPALALLEELGIPVILCSSKTRPELEHYRRLLNNGHPFVAENGGAVFIPKGYFPFPTGSVVRDYYEVLEFGLPYATLIQALEECRRKTGVPLIGLHELLPEEIARLTGLSLEEARWAKDREYDEPFLPSQEEARSVVEEWVGKAGLRISRGGRFFHLTGDNDKGKAVRALLALYRRGGDCRAVGIGDSANDLSMLEEVDLPFVVQRRDGTYDPEIKDPKIVRVAGVGPVGWNRAVLELLTGGGKRQEEL